MRPLAGLRLGARANLSAVGLPCGTLEGERAEEHDEEAERAHEQGRPEREEQDGEPREKDDGGPTHRPARCRARTLRANAIHERTVIFVESLLHLLEYSLLFFGKRNPLPLSHCKLPTPGRCCRLLRAGCCRLDEALARTPVATSSTSFSRSTKVATTHRSASGGTYARRPSSTDAGAAPGTSTAAAGTIARAP